MVNGVPVCLVRHDIGHQVELYTQHRSLDLVLTVQNSRPWLVACTPFRRPRQGRAEEREINGRDDGVRKRKRLPRLVDFVKHPLPNSKTAWLHDRANHRRNSGIRGD